MDVSPLCGPGPTALLLWATAPKMADALAVVRAWGFEYCTVWLVWVKRHRSHKPVLGCGSHTRSNAEFLLIGRRGEVGHLYDQALRATTSQVLETTSGQPRHSEKPPEARRLIERLFPDTVRAELFTRHAHRGWAGHGNEAGSRGGTATQPTLEQAWGGVSV
jgi:site-specific DNA-methyltransferase (adenine-specific)